MAIARNRSRLLSEATIQTPHPATNEIVLVNIAKIEDYGVYATLPEYGNVRGLILMSEMFNGRTDKPPDLRKRIGQHEIVKVLRSRNGYIDLSRKQVSPEERVQFRHKLQQPT